MNLYGWIDEVDDGIVYGRFCADEELAFEIPLLAVPECQRVDLQPGSYCSLVNGYLLIDKRIYTTHEMQQADVEASRLYHMLRPALSNGERQ